VTGISEGKHKDGFRRANTPRGSELDTRSFNCLRLSTAANQGSSALAFTSHKNKLSAFVLCEQEHIRLNIGTPPTSRITGERESIDAIDKLIPITGNAVEILVQNLMFDRVLSRMRCVQVTSPITRP
jgi:hypothetical protein